MGSEWAAMILGVDTKKLLLYIIFAGSKGYLNSYVCKEE
jgi:hypothetical protein